MFRTFSSLAIIAGICAAQSVDGLPLRAANFRSTSPNLASSGLSSGLRFAIHDYQNIELVKKTAIAASSGTVTGGPYGPALSYNGSSQGLSVNASSGDYPTWGNSFTIALILRVGNTAQTNTYVFQAGALGGQAAIIYGFVANSFEAFSDTFSGTNPRTGSQISVNDNDWHVLVYSYDGTTWAGYLDGVAVFSTARTFSITNGINFWVAQSNSGANTFAGDIAFAGFWDRGLSDAEAAALYQDPENLFQANELALTPGVTVLPAMVPRKRTVVVQ